MRASRRHDGDLLFAFVLGGSCTLECAGGASEPLVEGDAFCIPAGLAHALTGCSEQFEMLEASLPAIGRQGTVSATRS